MGGHSPVSGAKDNWLKRAARERQQATGESYLRARAALLAEALADPENAHWAAVRYLERNPGDARRDVIERGRDA